MGFHIGATADGKRKVSKMRGPLQKYYYDLISISGNVTFAE